jgi:hypothetical protein
MAIRNKKFAATTVINNIPVSVFKANGSDVRTMVQWQRAHKASGKHFSSTQEFVRAHASLHGCAVILWKDGHATVFSRDSSQSPSEKLLRTKFIPNSASPSTLAVQ